MNNFLKKQWDTLAAPYGASEKVIDDIFNQISKAYSSKSRHYHTLTHIAEMIKSAGEYKARIEDYDSLLFAIWFHDLVYTSLAGDNEEKSAEAAKKLLPKLNIPKEKINKVYSMILATKNHMGLAENADSDTKIFLDFDLKVLGVEKNSYIDYLKQIRKEYKLIPAFLYNSGRKRILKRFLEADFIFKTPDFRSLYEKQARENIQFELDQI
jgi:predicted metal-dependent HD superfamily phosphohydrolase